MGKRCFLSITLTGIALLLALPSSSAFIDRLTPLKDLLDDSDYIVVAQTESVSAENKLAVFTAREDLKGKAPFRTLRVQLTPDKEKHVPHLLKRIAPRVPVVFFITQVDKRWLGLGYTNGTWFQVLGQPAGGAVHWHFVHCEIYLRRTFKGTTDELITTVREVLAGQRKPPPPNPQEPPGLGPELPGEKSYRPAHSGRSLLAVILLPPIAGLLAPLLSLLFPGVLLAVWRQYRILVYVLLAQSTVLLVQSGLRWWEPSAWWLGPQHWWWPTLALYALGLIVAAVQRQRDASASWSQPVALEWAALGIMALVGSAWALLAWRWYGSALDQMAPITLGSLVGLLHLAVRGLASSSWRWAGWNTGNVMLTSMLLVALVLARQDWQSESFETPFTLTAQARTPTQDTWPMYRGNNYRTGCTDSSTVPQRPKILWTCNVAQGRGRFYFHCTPTLADGRAYFGILHQIQAQTRGYLYCVAVEEIRDEHRTMPPGTVLWRFDAAGSLKPVYCSPTVRPGRVYFGEGYHQDQHCRIFCLDAVTGCVLWQYPTRSHVESSPTLCDKMLVVGAGDDGLFAFEESTDGASVSVAWHIRDWHVDGSPLIVDGVVYAGSLVGDFLTTRTPFVAAFELASGRTLWRIEPTLPVAASLTWADGKVLVPLGNGKVNADDDIPLGGILCLDARTGQRVWLYENAGPVFSTPSFSQGRVYFGSKDGKIRCLEAESGELLWTRELDAAVIGSLVVAEDTVLAVSVRGTVYALSAETGEIRWRCDETAELAGDEPVYSSPVLYRGRIYLGIGSQLVCLGDE
ncbi:MAG: PQQ-binding-like beta-propeller repeat protein [Gemmatales bacterium]|nr:PQQ-like beta-propeller repeat protein [Gemmatales bacterium]MDW7995104.1 PQQ-binding-like beta-propeller repeat protein [Gemmatales bacterium]